jgi:signal transduction histidine kinase
MPGASSNGSSAIDARSGTRPPAGTRGNRFGSLRTRLLIALSAIVLVGWSIAFGTWLTLNLSEQSVWDRSLRESAKIALASLPADFDRLLAEAALAERSRNPDGSAAVDKESDIGLQVWVNGRKILRTPGAPAAALKPDFAEGFADQPIDGQLWRVYDLADSTGKVHVQVGKSPRQRADAMLHAAGIATAATLALIALPGLAIWWVTRWSFAPIDDLRRTMAMRKALDLAPLPADRVPVEVQPLIESFNALLRQLEGAVENERRFIADAAHELRTPLAVLLAQVQVVLNADDAAEKNLAARRLAAGVERSARLSEQLLDLARLDAGNPASGRVVLDLSELVALVVRDFENSARQRRQSIVLEIETTPIRADVDDIGILVRNLLDNALRYGEDGGCVDVSCRRARHGGAEYVELSVRDDGPGVPVGERTRMFQRFHRIAGSRVSGSGIGLSLVERIAHAHGASIEVGTGLRGIGLGIAIRFPAVPVSAQGVSAPDSGEAAPS